MEANPTQNAQGEMTEDDLKYAKKIKITTVMLIGPTGVGKSTLYNKMLDLKGDEAAKTSSSGNSCTTKPKWEKGLLLGNKELGRMLRVIDTPGLLYTEKRDAQFLQEMVKTV